MMMNLIDTHNRMVDELISETDKLIRFLINEGLVKVDDMQNEEAPAEAVKVIATLRAQLETVERERDALREALQKMANHFGMTEKEMRPQLQFMNKKSIAAIRAANAALAQPQEPKP